MGRYYYGDIEGKFWFAVQPSDAADRFGVYGEQPQRIQYYFSKEDLENVQNELKNIETNLGEHKEAIDTFFKSKEGGYTDEMLALYLNVPLEKEQHLLREYADYLLGKKIEQCIIDTDHCDFEGEL